MLSTCTGCRPCYFDSGGTKQGSIVLEGNEADLSHLYYTLASSCKSSQPPQNCCTLPGLLITELQGKKDGYSYKLQTAQLSFLSTFLSSLGVLYYCDEWDAWHHFWRCNSTWYHIFQDSKHQSKVPLPHSQNVKITWQLPNPLSYLQGTKDEVMSQLFKLLLHTLASSKHMLVQRILTLEAYIYAHNTNKRLAHKVTKSNKTAG